MEMQFKLYILNKLNMQDTLTRLYDAFGQQNIVSIEENKIAIKYDYEKNDYKFIVEKMNEFPVTQNIVTASKFLKLLRESVKTTILIDDIKLLDVFDKENETLKEYINKANYSKQNKFEYLNQLLEELRWLNYSEGIDIKSMSFRVKSSTKPIYIRFTLYDSGILILDDEEIGKQTWELIKTI